MERTPERILDDAFQRASVDLNVSLIDNAEILERLKYVAGNLKNRAGVRLVLSCLLAKIHRPELDVRKPYTEIGEPDSFSGRTYDERYLSPFIARHELPCNSTTAFLTPAFRNRNATLTPDIDMVGRPAQLYEAVLLLLDDVYQKRIDAETLLADIVRELLAIREERQNRIESLLKGLKSVEGGVPLSTEDIVQLVRQHLSLKGTSRLPVLIVVAIYNSVEALLKERVIDLQAHNAADVQTGSIGDVEITVIGDEKIVTCYEMKDRKVTKEDIDHALHKVLTSSQTLDNYIFITTEEIDQELTEYAQSLYERTHGIEFAVLDCIGFLRNILHFLHRMRSTFLEFYQELLLAEPESSVSQLVKEAFLSMRQTAESESGEE